MGYAGTYRTVTAKEQRSTAGSWIQRQEDYKKAVSESNQIRKAQVPSAMQAFWSRLSESTKLREE
jgi:hypothetical protein